MTGIDGRSGQNSRLKPIEDPDSPAGQLGQALRDLVSDEPLRQLAPRTPCAVAVVSEALSGDPSKVPTMTIIERICKAYGADESTTKWVLAMRKAIKSKDRASGDPPLSPPDPDRGDPLIPPGLAPADSSPPGPSRRCTGTIGPHAVEVVAGCGVCRGAGGRGARVAVVA